MNLFSVVLLVVASVSCTVAEDWWEGGNFYQIYPRSFQDSDGDGIGDLNGIRSRLYHLKELGIDGVWLSPIFESPMVDFGYDTSDYRKIYEKFGTMEDFEALAAECEKLNIKLILDFVPNHTSDKHDWFIRSANNETDYRDFYMWHPGVMNTTTGIRQPPSNWLSAFRGSAWEWHEGRQEYYLHQFAIQQPDLNYRNPKVVQEMKDVLTFWMDHGVYGFRVDAVPYLFEVPLTGETYPDEPLSNKCTDPLGECYLDHIYTQNLDETFDMVFQWRSVLDNHTATYGGPTRIMMVEAYTSLANTMRLYGTESVNGSQIPFNFDLITSININSTAADAKTVIERILTNLPTRSDVHANWVLGNHDQKRIGTRLGEYRMDLYNTLLQTLPGIAVTYNGEEIGMTDVFISWEDSVDPQACNTDPDTYLKVSRDPCRTPFQWDDSENAGFSTSDNGTWLPIADDYKTVNVKEEYQSQKSHLNTFHTLTRLRKLPEFQFGSLDMKLIGNDVLVYERAYDGPFKYIVVLNFANNSITVDLTSVLDRVSSYPVVLSTSVQSKHHQGWFVSSRSLELAAGDALILASAGNMITGSLIILLINCLILLTN